jgi:tetraacyldisaccharide 4'-kinase
MDFNSRGLVNYLLLPISAIFYGLSFIRKTLYRWGFLRINRFNIPVIVVGNITVGGSGKTPIVIALAQYFKQQGRKVGVVSRGYGGAHHKGSLLVDKRADVFSSGDEPLLIALQTKVPVMINKNRAQAVQDLIDQHQVELVISDDGLQHYAMGRSIEIAVVDGLRRFGNGFFLPAGPLRESKKRLKSVDFVINNGVIFPDEIHSQLKPLEFIQFTTGNKKPLDFFNHQYCHAVAGIGFPERFFQTLKNLKIKLIEHPFPDHHQYQPNELEFADDYPIIMTAKDWVKCRTFATDKMYFLETNLDISSDFLNNLNAKL